MRLKGTREGGYFDLVLVPILCFIYACETREGGHGVANRYEAVAGKGLFILITKQINTLKFEYPKLRPLIKLTPKVYIILISFNSLGHIRR